MGVRQGTVVSYDADLTGTQSEASFGRKATGHIVVQGPTATLPVIATVDTTARGYRCGDLNESTGTCTFSMKLPADATCTSRSGQAFGGLCPLAQ